MIKRWGGYLTLIDRKHFKVKLLYFKRNGEISYQRHKQREEIWLFLTGNGLFTKHRHKGRPIKHTIRAGEIQKVGKNIWHHFKALKSTLVLEVQTGTCKERDIERR